MTVNDERGGRAFTQIAVRCSKVVFGRLLRR